MALREEKYDQNKIDAIKRYLHREATNGRPKYFEISVDGFKVIARTSNLEEFDEYETELTESTRSVIITVYDGPTTPRNTKHLFKITPIATTGTDMPATLGDFDQLIQQRLDEKDRQYELDQLKKKVADLEKQLTEAEEYSSQLETACETLKTNQGIKATNFGQLGAALVEQIIIRNASKIPGGEMLAGLLGTGQENNVPQAQQHTQPDAEATFQKQQPAQPPLTAEQFHHLHNLEVMEKYLSVKQITVISDILRAFVEQPEQIDVVADLLNVNPNK